MQMLAGTLTIQEIARLLLLKVPENCQSMKISSPETRPEAAPCEGGLGQLFLGRWSEKMGERVGNESARVRGSRETLTIRWRLLEEEISEIQGNSYRCVVWNGDAKPAEKAQG